MAETILDVDLHTTIATSTALSKAPLPLTIATSEAVTVGKAVAYNSSGEAQLAKADDTSRMPCIGICMSVDGSMCVVQRLGLTTGGVFAGLTTGAYVVSTTAGEIIHESDTGDAAYPNQSGNQEQVVGRAISATVMDVKPSTFIISY